MAQAGVAYVEIRPDWAGFNREIKRQTPGLNQQFGKMGGEFGGKLAHGVAGAGKQAGLLFAKSATAAAKVGAVGLAGGFAYAVTKAANFEQQLSALGSVSGASAKEMESLRAAAIEAGAGTKFSALEAAQAQTELAKGGLATSQILKGGLSSALALAAAGELDLADAASTTVNAMKLFKIRGKDSIKVADALATAANSTTADVSDFALALSQAGSAAKTVGLSFPETITALEALAEVGIKGSDAGTSLKTMLVQLASPASDKAAKKAKELGINIFDTTGKIKPLVDVSKELQDGLGGLNKQQRISAATTLVGQDGFRALLALYDAGPKKIQKLETELNKQGTAAKVAKEKQDNLKGSMEQLGGSLETVGVQVGTLFIPWIRKGADELTDFTGKISKIIENDKLDLGEKLSKSFEVAKVTIDPWLNKLKAEIVQADIPGEIGDLLTRGSDRIGEGFEGGPFVNKLVAQIKDADLPTKLGELISEVTPKIAEAIGKGGALAAGAFAKAFISADAWGKLALGGWLLAKMGGVSAFRGLGAKAGLNFNTGFTTTSAITAGGVVGAPVVAGVKQNTGPKGAPTSKSGLTAGNPLGLVGSTGGLTHGSPLKDTGPKVGLTGPTRGQQFTAGAAGVGAVLAGPVGAALTAAIVATITAGLSNKQNRSEDAAKTASTFTTRATQLSQQDPEAFDAVTRAIDMQTGRVKFNREEYDRLLDKMEEVGISMGYGRDQVDAVTSAFDGIRGPLTAVNDAIARMAGGADVDFKRFGSSIKNLRTNVRLNTKLIKNALGEDTAEGKAALAANFRAAADNVQRSMDAAGKATKEGTAEIERLMVLSLSQFGFSKKQALNIARTGDQDANAGREGGASSVIKKARGGPITGGAPVGDSVPALLERDEYVLNRKAVKKIGRRALDAVNFGSAPRFQVGGSVQRFAGGGSVTGDTDFLPGLLSALKRLSAAAGQGIYVQSGRRTVAEQLAQGPSTPGHPVAGPNGPHVRGVAADITPGFPAFGALAGKFGLGFTVMPQEPWHIQLLDAIGGAASIAAPELKKLLVGGPDSPLKSAVQGGLDTVRGAAQKVLDRAAAASGANGTESAPVGGGGGSTAGGGADLMRSISKVRGWNFNDWWALDAKETGHGANLSNPTSTARLRGQFLDMNYGKYGPGSDPSQNPSMSQQIQAMAAYISERYGNPSKALAFHNAHNYYQRGGIVDSVLRLAPGGPVKGPPKGLKPLIGGLDLGKALSRIATGRTTKLKDAATSKLLESITGIGFAGQASTLARLSGNVDVFGENADRAGRLTDTSKIQKALEDEAAKRGGVFPGDEQQKLVDTLLGRVGGNTQLDWLTQQLGALFDWRNVIADTDPIVVRLRDETSALLADAQSRLEKIAAEIKKAEREYARVEKERDRAVKHEETLKDRIDTEMDKPAKKRNKKKLEAWREDLIGTHSEHVELNQTLANMRGEQRVRERLQTDLDEKVIPALTTKRDDLAGSHDGLVSNLIDAQGLGGPATRLGALPPLGALGGKLFDVQSLMKDLTDNPPRIEATVPGMSEGEQRSKELLGDLLREANQRTAVSEATFDVFKSFPYGGAFKDGGIIPGPVGAPVMILGHGGEEVLPVGDTNGGGSRVRVVVEDHRTRVFVDDVEQIVETYTRKQARTGARGLPGVGGGNIR